MCVFHQESYIQLLKLLITSISVKANFNTNTTDILIITSPSFQPLIQKELEGFDLPLHYYILDLHTLFEAACARLNIFKYEHIHKYDTILYLDTDILLNSDVNVLFNLDLSTEKIYALEEGCIGHTYWGQQFFDFTNCNSNTTAFTSGILLFRNSDSIKSLFDAIQLHIVDYIYTKKNSVPSCMDQPFIVYNAISQNKYDNQLLKKYAENRPNTITSEKIIYHFSGGLGSYASKLPKMSAFWTQMNTISKVLFQTYKTHLDTHVTDMIKDKLNSEWIYEFYNDEDVLQFFINNPIATLPDILTKYNAIKSGAHRADLFRYYYLYLKGGIFMDSDAMIYTDIDTIVNNYNFVSVKSSRVPDALFQGILGASPKNEIIKRALYQAYTTDPTILDEQYHLFCKQLYDIVNGDRFGYSIKLYQEKINTPNSGDTVCEGNTILFKHYWSSKKIPIHTTPYTDEFTKIYNTNYWIKGSGTGSYIENTIEYNKCIVNFIKTNSINSVTDIGCGDWQSSYLIYDQINTIDYLGIDCVSSVIETNKKNHPNYKFNTLDILCNTPLIRNSDLYIMKDVLQHWKLTDIYNFLDKLVMKEFKYIIITNNGNQMCDNLELDKYIGIGRGLHSNFLPLKKYNAELLLNYYGGENKHMCIIRKDSYFIKKTHWNNYNTSELNMFDYRILSTYKIPNTLIRVGPSYDGGYVIADGFNYDLFISCGIANDIRFEDAFLDIHKIQCVAFDGTIISFPSHRNTMKWIPKNIGYSNTETTTNLKEYIQDKKNIFLKMDIEGSEFNWLDSMTETELDNFSQIVIEIHWPFDIYRMNMLKKLNTTHYIIHIHGNNYCDKDIPKHLPSGRTYDGTVTIHHNILDTIRLPEVFEVTYINKKLCKNLSVEIKEIQFPTVLDFPNNPNAKDIYFSIPVSNYTSLVNKKYSWGTNSITFLENGQMDAFGKGTYIQQYAYIVQANFGGRIHTFVFNDDYTKFTSIRNGDNLIVKGKLVGDISPRFARADVLLSNTPNGSPPIKTP
jgi:lipopolysaccharide biosynthesis glycosyltransferase